MARKTSLTYVPRFQGTKVSLQVETSKWRTKLNSELLRRLQKIGRMMKSYFYYTLTGPRTGNIYRVTALGWLNHPHAVEFTYQASASHEYPAEKTGLLRRSIRYKTGMSLKGPFLHVGVIMPAAAYAIELENPSSRGARPFLRRGMIENEEEMKKILNKRFVYKSPFGA